MRPLGLILAALVAACSQSSPSAPQVPPGPVPSVTTTFPLHVQSGSRLLVDAAGKPFMLRGDNPSSLAVMLTQQEVARYLDDRRDRGFNTILFEVLEHKFSTRPPYNRGGDAPFTGTRANANGSKCANTAIADCWDFTTPNEAYWKNIDAIVEAARQRGFLVMLFAAYIGYNGQDEGWYQDMLANGPEVLTRYGTFLASRYQHCDNILWVQGGDYIPENRALVDAVANGIRSVLPQALQTVHTSRGHAAANAWPATSWLNVNNIYTSYSVHGAAREQYTRSASPFFLIEAVYENPTPLFPKSPSATAKQVRAQAYEAMLGGTFGQIMGNNPLWYFGPGWERALNSPGARSMSALFRIFLARSWWLLKPDSDELIVSGQSDDAFAPAALASDRSFALVYFPEARRMAIDTKRLAGPRLSARWYDPSTGSSFNATEEPLTNEGRHTFKPSGKNAGGDDDWVLVLESVH